MHQGTDISWFLFSPCSYESIYPHLYLSFFYLKFYYLLLSHNLLLSLLYCTKHSFRVIAVSERSMNAAQSSTSGLRELFRLLQTGGILAGNWNCKCYCVCLGAVYKQNHCFLFCLLEMFTDSRQQIAVYFCRSPLTNQLSDNLFPVDLQRFSLICFSQAFRVYLSVKNRCVSASKHTWRHRLRHSACWPPKL